MVPETVFIVPYRDREPHRKALLEAMADNLADWNPDTYKIMFVHQCDKRPFNRGAMKNIGFIVIKNAFPKDYQDITIVFHDVDTWPCEKGLVSYSTTQGVVRHFYGYDFALGGLVAIKAGDFEMCGGFPNLWGWGIEDNTLQDRVLDVGLSIDRSNFYHIDDPRIRRMFDGMTRLVAVRDPGAYRRGVLDGLRHVHDLQYHIIGDMINVTSFAVGTSAANQEYREHDIRQGSKLPVLRENIRKGWNMKLQR
jgi:hypothetical protein